MRDTGTTPTETPSRWKQFVLPVAWMVAIFFGSGQEKLPSPSGIPGFDKLAHFGAYGLLATLWARVFTQPGRPWRTALIALAVASIYGISDEFHQSFTPGRSVEVADWVADTAGAALAVAVYCFWPAYRSLMDRRILGRPPDSVSVPAASTAQRQET